MLYVGCFSTISEAHSINLQMTRAFSIILSRYRGLGKSHQGVKMTNYSLEIGHQIHKRYSTNDSLKKAQLI